MMIVCNWLNAKNVVMLDMDTNSQTKVVYIFGIYTRNSRKHNNAIMASVEEAVTHYIYIYILYCIYIPTVIHIALACCIYIYISDNNYITKHSIA